MVAAQAQLLQPVLPTRRKAAGTSGCEAAHWIRAHSASGSEATALPIWPVDHLLRRQAVDHLQRSPVDHLLGRRTVEAHRCAVVEVHGRTIEVHGSGLMEG